MEKVQGIESCQSDTGEPNMNANTIRATKGRGMLYNSILDTVGDTPVVRINNLAPNGVRVYVKIESFNPAASIKDRLVEHH